MKKRPVNDQGKLVLDLPEDDWRMQLFASFNESLEMCGGLRLADAESAEPQGADAAKATAVEERELSEKERDGIQALFRWEYGESLLRGEMSQQAYDLLAKVFDAALHGRFDEMHDALEQDVRVVAANVHNQTFRKLLKRMYEHGVACGDVVSCCGLANMYHHASGRVCPEDYAIAMRLYGLGIQRGDMQCAVNLGYMYYYGRGTEVDYNKAFQCYALAAVAEDNPEALWKLGDLYADGKGVTRSDRMAWTLYSKAYQLSGGMPWGCRAAHHVADYLLRGVSGMLEADPLRALELYMKAELGYYEVIAKGQTYYRKCLDKAIRGQEKARRAIWETGA